MSDTYTHSTCILYEIVVLISQCCFLGSSALPYMVGKELKSGIRSSSAAEEVWSKHVLCSGSLCVTFLFQEVFDWSIHYDGISQQLYTRGGRT